jgi:DNA-binding transcriptional ArsR family regulator
VARTQRIRDPAVLKAVTHPLRLRLYELLSVLGPATVGTLAGRCDAAPGQVSFHLRTLARHGFVEPAPDCSSDGRQSWWRAVAGGVSFRVSDLPARAADAAIDQLLRDHFERIAEYRADPDRYGPAWRNAELGTDARLRMSPAELAEFEREIGAVVRRWVERTLPGDPDDGREYVYFLAHAFPYQP